MLVTSGMTRALFFFQQTHRLKLSLISYNKFIKFLHFIVVFVDILATTAAFVGMTPPGVAAADSTISSGICVEVGRTPRLGSPTCLALF